MATAGPGRAQPEADRSPVDRAARNVGVGCFTFIAGLFSGAMIGVLIAKIVGGVTRCAPGAEGQPCDWHIYAGYGAVTGAILLPTIALGRLMIGDAAARRGERAAAGGEHSNRG